MSKRKKLIAGNWKMNGTLDEARTLIADILNGLYTRPGLLETCEFLVCPPFLHIPAIRHALYKSDNVKFGAQNCSRWPGGAHTGNVSAAMLKDSGCTHVILGHSERRAQLGETSAVVAEKAVQAHGQGLVTIICIGETESERAQGREKDVVRAQLEQSLPACATAENTVIAYEPVWAIGTGKNATPEDAGVMHGFIRSLLKDRIKNHETMRILYGGSMKPDNAALLLAVPDVDGGLIGGASLKASEFLGIAQRA